MCKLAVILIGISCASDGRRVQASLEHLQSKPLIGRHTVRNVLANASRSSESAAWIPVAASRLGHSSLVSEANLIAPRGIAGRETIIDQGILVPKSTMPGQRRPSHQISMSSESDGIKDGAEKSYIDKLALILVTDRKQLVVRSKGKSAFFTPGGKREKGESDEEALVRECQEELSVDLKKESIKPYGVFEAQAFGKPEGTMVRMTCFTADYEGTLQASEEIEELSWITSAFPHEQLSVTGIMILDDLKSKNLID